MPRKQSNLSFVSCTCSEGRRGQKVVDKKSWTKRVVSTQGSVAIKAIADLPAATGQRGPGRKLQFCQLPQKSK